MEYRLDQTCGIIYTWEEYRDDNKGTYNFGIRHEFIQEDLEQKWRNLPVIDMNVKNPEELREKMFYLYGNSNCVLHPGDIIKKESMSSQSFVVIEVNGTEIIVEQITRGMPAPHFKWKGKFVKLMMNYASTGPSLIDKMKPYQMAYNLLMNQLDK